MTDTCLLTQAARAMAAVVLFIVILRLLVNERHVKASIVSCDVTSVSPLTNTSITCHFPENVSQTMRIITVSFYKGAQYTAEYEDDILDCWWISGIMDCAAQPGFKFNRVISHELTLEIPRVSAKNIGGYACKLDRMNTKDIRPCELKIQLEGKTMCDVPSVTFNSRTSLTCYFPQDLNKTRTGFSVYRYSSRSDPGEVMSCEWKGDNLFCNTYYRGYEFDRTVASHLTLSIPNAQEHHEGFYSCHLTSAANVHYDNCSLTLMTVTSSCNITSVKETEPASLTCTFNVDVNATKQNFSLVHLSSDDSTGAHIVNCTWVKDQLRCTTVPGYEFNNIVTHHLVITVPRASRDHNGTYACHVTGSSKDGFHPCYLIIKQDGHVIVMAVGIAVAILIPVLLVIFILIFKYKRRNIQTKNVLFEGIPLQSPVELENLVKQEFKFWQKWVKAAFPNLRSTVYFLPPVYVNRVPMTKETIAGQDVWVLQSAPRQTDESNLAATIEADDRDVRHDAAMQRFLVCLQTMCQQNKEVLVGLSQLLFNEYLCKPCYAAAARKLPLPVNLPLDLPGEYKQGFDVLLIHRHYGLVTCEVKTFDRHVNKHNMQQENMIQETNTEIRKILREAIVQQDQAETMLTQLVSDIARGPRITKTIALPNLTVSQVKQALAEDPELTKDLCRCLGTTHPADITGLCICSDQLSDPRKPWDVSSHVLRELGLWWQRRVAGAGTDSHMTLKLYKTLVARFCGPATSVTVPCTCPPRVSVKTLGQAVWCTGECYTAVITLFPEQLHLLNTQPPTVFVTGPPGTGKTVVLLMMGIKWLRCGHPVYIVSIWDESRAACIMLHHLLLQTVNTQQSAGVSPGQLHLLMYDLYEGKDVEKAVNDLSQAASGGSLYVIADEVRRYFNPVCDKLLAQVPHLHLWAASCFHEEAPPGWQVEHLTRPLRSPPAVVREVKQTRWITKYHDVKPYRERGVPDHTDGPPVRRVYHRGQGHSGDRPRDCVTCGREVASFLHSLRVGVTENVTTTATTVISTSGSTTPPCLQWRDVLVLYWGYISDDSGMVKALQEAGIPVRVMKDDDIEDVATARSDVVWMTDGRRVSGLERKVVVCLFDDDDDRDRLYSMSRCTSQLVIVYDDHKP